MYASIWRTQSIPAGLLLINHIFQPCPDSVYQLYHFRTWPCSKPYMSKQALIKHGTRLIGRLEFDHRVRAPNYGHRSSTRPLWRPTFDVVPHKGYSTYTFGVVFNNGPRAARLLWQSPTKKPARGPLLNTIPKVRVMNKPLGSEGEIASISGLACYRPHRKYLGISASSDHRQYRRGCPPSLCVYVLGS